MRCESVLSKGTVSREFSFPFWSKIYPGSIWTSKNGYTTFLVFAKIFKKNADVHTVSTINGYSESTVIFKSIVRLKRLSLDFYYIKRKTNSSEFTEENLSVGKKCIVNLFYLKRQCHEIFDPFFERKKKLYRVPYKQAKMLAYQQLTINSNSESIF